MSAFHPLLPPELHVSATYCAALMQVWWMTLSGPAVKQAFPLAQDLSGNVTTEPPRPVHSASVMAIITRFPGEWSAPVATGPLGVLIITVPDFATGGTVRPGRSCATTKADPPAKNVATAAMRTIESLCIMTLSLFYGRSRVVTAR